MPDVRAPKVLVSSVTAWNDRTGADTFSALFAGYETDKLANLYIREEMPNSSVCRHYFRISESKVIRSILDRTIKTGREMTGCDSAPDETDIEALEDTKARYERHRRSRRWLLLYARELIWMFGRWRTPELDAFIEGFRPEVVVFGMEGYIHFNRINRYIVKKSGARAIGYFYDDNFTYKQKPWSLGHRIYRFFQRRDLKKTAACCDAFFAISPKTKRECDAFFGIDSVLLTKPARCEDEARLPHTPRSPVRMLYTGNLLYGRLKTIELLSDAIGKVNAGGVKVELDLYTTTDVTAAEAHRFDRAVHLHGGVSQGDALAKQREADVLLFAEALRGPESKVARLSFSTKLTDYLQSGRCVLAIGDPSIAPMEYLQSEDAAICATSEAAVVRQLERMIEDPDLIVEYGRKAIECACRNHDGRLMRRSLYDTIAAVVDRSAGYTC